MHITSKNIAKVPTGCVRTHIWKASFVFLVVNDLMYCASKFVLMVHLNPELWMYLWDKFC